RGGHVTGVQTCALPIWNCPGGYASTSESYTPDYDLSETSSSDSTGFMRYTYGRDTGGRVTSVTPHFVGGPAATDSFGSVYTYYRSKERRVGKECVVSGS